MLEKSILKMAYLKETPRSWYVNVESGIHIKVLAYRLESRKRRFYLGVHHFLKKSFGGISEDLIGRSTHSFFPAPILGFLPEKHETVGINAHIEVRHKHIVHPAKPLVPEESGWHPNLRKNFKIDVGPTWDPQLQLQLDTI